MTVFKQFSNIICYWLENQIIPPLELMSFVELALLCGMKYCRAPFDSAL